MPDYFGTRKYFNPTNTIQPSSLRPCHLLYASSKLFNFLIYFRRDIVLPGDLFTGTSNWSDREESEAGEDSEAEEDGEPGVMTRW